MDTAPPQQPYASPTFSSKRRSRLDMWREKHRTQRNCQTCSPKGLMIQQQRHLSIQSIAEKHTRKHQVPQELCIAISNNNDIVSPLSMNQSSSSSYYEEESSPETTSRFIEEGEEVPTASNKNNKQQPPPPVKLFPSSSSKRQVLSNHAGEKENQVNRQLPRKTNTARKSLLDRRSSSTPQPKKNANNAVRNKILTNRSKKSTQATVHSTSPSLAIFQDDTPSRYDVHHHRSTPSIDYTDILSEYDERVRSVYMEAAAEAASQETESPTKEDDSDVPESSILFFQEFQVERSMKEEIISSSSDDETSPLMVQHRRRRHVSLHPLREEEESQEQSTPQSGVDMQPDAPSETSDQSSPCFAAPIRRRRLSVPAMMVHLPEEDTNESSSSSDSSDDDDESCSQGQATVIADREELLGGLPVHEGRTVLTAISERRVALDVDMVEHRRLAMECRKLRDRLVLALAENHDKNREFQRLQLEAPKLQQQLVDARNQVVSLQTMLRQYQV